MTLTRARVRVEGIVQGVGFRPFVHALAGRLVKTVSRWVGGETEPRLRELRRIHKVFGEAPLG